MSGQADSFLLVDQNKYGDLLVSTILRDEDGNIVIEMHDNCWETAKRPIVWDKNYSTDTIEVLDRGGFPVFRMRLLSSFAFIEGEWHVVDTKIPYGRKGLIGLQSSHLNNRVFQYPSQDHWAEYNRETLKTLHWN